ncbi:extracellular solute-binding protein [Coraliomargarita sp. SDUM461003]|uniref:Extracellular solute-binding protein n=1 Tax=Thalassobacterium maritimum TaxID=3041265 RepID=A0ABU1AU22_9BACT|nr:extracellular solute-binding protein [Coraliomargarita sp. SDUM461003]MDQ8206739.1 extracellular solute-binding protein [Coraliomargarita sp. SDUM461003]
MTKSKVSIVRNYILSMLESSEIQAGDRVPPAREIAETLGISFLKVQHAVESLCQNGVLHTRSRQGAFVLPDWRERILPENVCVYNPVEQFPWIDGMLSLVSDSIPGLRSSFAFRKGTLELRTTTHLLTQYEDYMDLSEIFEECFPDRDDFFTEPFSPFEIDGQMVGIPFAFSPRVVFYNPTLFEKAGCVRPQAGWTWSDFLKCVRKLKKILPADKIINYSPREHMFMNFIVRAGGRLFDPSAEDPVTLDSPRVAEGLRLCRQLGNLVGTQEYDEDELIRSFVRGEAGMHISGRHHMDFIVPSGFDDWNTVPMPLFEGGVDCSAQATDLVCVRKSCSSPELAKRYVREMLSARVQDYIGQSKHNIPIRKSSAFKSLDINDPRDALFASEITKISTNFNLHPPYPGALVLKGISQILEEKIDIEEGLGELAQAARTILGICSEGRRGAKMQSVFSRRKRP